MTVSVDKVTPEWQTLGEGWAGRLGVVALGKEW
jgi:hypothetical protein